MMPNNISFLSTNSLSLSTKDPQFCSILRFIGYYFLVLWIAGTILNGSVLYILIRNKELRQSSTNLLIGGLLFADFIGSCFELPLPTFSLIYCRWIFTYAGCVFEAIVVYFAGCSNMYMLCLISIDRYRKINRPFFTRRIETKPIYLAIASTYLLSLFWALIPLAGWSSYNYEGIGISCSINWIGRSLNIVSYNITIFIFVYLIPVLIIVITNIKIYSTIRNQWHDTMMNYNQNRLRHQRQIQRQVLFTITMIIGGFFIAWTPYAIIVFIRIIYGKNFFPPIIDTIPALFAKTSLVRWNPLIYTIRNGNFRTHIPFFSSDQHRSQQGKNSNEIKFSLYPYSMVQFALPTPMNTGE
ncbi:hypothetical protein I4U23_001680 [Adineta vaga]|nr:hypothetical protein I4U23_001680 [Adineta vaga]